MGTNSLVDSRIDLAQGLEWRATVEVEAPAHVSVNRPGLEDLLKRTLVTAFRGSSRVAVVGDGHRVAGLAEWKPDLFVPAEAYDGQAPGQAEVLAFGTDESTLTRAASTARRLGLARLSVVAERDRRAEVEPFDLSGTRSCLRAAGLALASIERVLWAAPGGDIPSAASRAERIATETGALLLRCVLVDDPRAVELLEEAILELQRQLDVYAQLAVDHAATREVERVRTERLRELETELQQLRGLDLAAEVERLRAELELIQATRLWRLGARWWRLKARFRRRTG